MGRGGLAVDALADASRPRHILQPLTSRRAPRSQSGHPQRAGSDDQRPVRVTQDRPDAGGDHLTRVHKQRNRHSPSPDPEPRSLTRSPPVRERQPSPPSATTSDAAAYSAAACDSALSRAGKPAPGGASACASSADSRVCPTDMIRSTIFATSTAIARPVGVADQRGEQISRMLGTARTAAAPRPGGLVLACSDNLRSTSLSRIRQKRAPARWAFSFPPLIHSCTVGSVRLGRLETSATRRR